MSSEEELLIIRV